MHDPDRLDEDPRKDGWDFQLCYLKFFIVNKNLFNKFNLILQ